jgi:hypothetical protein
MSDRFISGLHDDLVEAMERYERRSARGRLAAGRYPRLLRPVVLTRLAAAAAIVVAAVAGIRSLAPEPAPARPHVVGVLRIGGSPVDVAFADGSLWISDFTGSVVHVDAEDRRVVTRIKVGGAPQPVGVGAGSVWVHAEGAGCGGSLIRVDPRTGRVVARSRVGFPDEQAAVVAVVGGGVWVSRACKSGGVDRLDLAGAKTASVPLIRLHAMVAAGRNLWVLSRDGTLTEIDPMTGHVRHRLPGVAPMSDPTATAMNALVADGTGVWVLSTARAAILHIEPDGVVRRIAVDASARPLLAKAPDGLWMATSDALDAHNRLIRIDPATGRPTATLELGDQQPTALIPAGDELCVVTVAGNVLFVRS